MFFLQNSELRLLGDRQLHFDVLANAHFGFVGRAAGFDAAFLKAGAGAAQLKRFSDIRNPNELGDCLGSYCDHPYATWSVGLGSYLYDKSGQDLNEEKFRIGLEDYVKDNPIPEPPPFSAP